MVAGGETKSVTERETAGETDSIQLRQRGRVSREGQSAEREESKQRVREQTAPSRRE